MSAVDISAEDVAIFLSAKLLFSTTPQLSPNPHLFPLSHAKPPSGTASQIAEKSLSLVCVPAGLLDNAPRQAAARKSSPSPAVPTQAAAPAAAAQTATVDDTRQPVTLAPSSAPSDLKLATAAAVSMTAAQSAAKSAAAQCSAQAAVSAVPAATTSAVEATTRQVPVSHTTAAINMPQLQPSKHSQVYTDNVPVTALAPIPSAKPATPAGLPSAVTESAAATASIPATTAGMAPATADSPEATAQHPTANIYSPIRSPPASTLPASSVPPQATLPTPQLNPLPPPPQSQYQHQQPSSNAGITPYATAEQVAAWQQQQAYQGYYGGAYPYTDPSYGYTYPQMTQPHPGFGIPPSTPVGVSAPQAPPGAVAPPRPPPLGPNSPPPKRPVASKQVGGLPQAGQHAASLATSAPAAVPASAGESVVLPFTNLICYYNVQVTLSFSHQPNHCTQKALSEQATYLSFLRAHCCVLLQHDTLYLHAYSCNRSFFSLAVCLNLQFINNLLSAFSCMAPKALGSYSEMKKRLEMQGMRHSLTQHSLWKLPGCRCYKL